MESLRSVSFWERSVDGTVGSRFESVAGIAEEEEGRTST